MDKGYPVPEIAKYEKNFFNGTQPSTPEAQLYYAELQRKTDIIAGIIDEMRGTCNEEEILQEILLNTYDFVIDRGVKKGIKYDIFASYYVHDEAFDACYFMSLCQFLYESRRIKGKSLRKFIYDNSLRGYNVKGSPYYFNFAEKKRVFIESNSDNPENSSEQILKDENTLRQYRKRLFKKRPGRRDSVEWSAMRKVSEHEWRSYFLLAKADKEVRDTEKRIRNLYKDIHMSIDADIDDDYENKLDRASEKFCSKLKKIQYESYLNLIKYLLEHICKDKTCYGVNLYRLEKGLKPYRITTDVNQLVESVSETELEWVVNQSILMDNIVFPKLYKYFGCIPDNGRTQTYAVTFQYFLDDFVRSSRLIIDKFIEDGVFGEDWEKLFLKTTNELAESVLFSPSEINYSLTPESQLEFQIYLLEPVDCLIAHKKEQAKINREDQFAE